MAGEQESNEQGHANHHAVAQGELTNRLEDSEQDGRERAGLLGVRSEGIQPRCSYGLPPDS